jgi:hypothetical protein
MDANATVIMRTNVTQGRALPSSSGCSSLDHMTPELLVRSESWMLNKYLAASIELVIHMKHCSVSVPSYIW